MARTTPRSRPEQPKPVQTSTQDVPMSKDDHDFYSKQRRSRSIALAVALGAIVIIFYIVSLIQGPGILARSV